MLTLVLALTLGAPLQEPASRELSAEDLRSAGRVIGLELSDGELELMLPELRDQLRQIEVLRQPVLANDLPPALVFDPLLPGMALRPRAAGGRRALVLEEVQRPVDLGDLCFADIATLAGLVRSRAVSCRELTELCLERLSRLDAHLFCVTELLAERALAQADVLDAELAEGRWRGPLHGIPWGAKDLFAVRGTRTTWGAAPFREQRIESDASVVRRLDEAGAILVAKLSLGALAMGDVWYGGLTRNPWNLEQGSSGSSAGSSAAVAAGALPFALGTETLGSIVSPATRCGVSGLRPTFGRVSRAGAMALVWSMDKVGPIARSAADASLVLAAIAGPDGIDGTVRAHPFDPALDLSVDGWRVGIPRGAFGEGSRYESVLDELEALGVELVEVDLPRLPVQEMLIVLGVEAATAFDELTRSGQDDELTRQDRGAWPNVFRAARLVPGVEYLRAQRLRTQLMREMDAALAGIEVLVYPSFAAGVLSITNLTGHPTFVAPCGPPRISDEGEFRGIASVSFTGHLFDEERLLALARAWQAATPYDEQHPPLDFLDR